MNTLKVLDWARSSLRPIRRTLIASLALSIPVTLHASPAAAWANGSGTCPFGTSDAYWTAGTRPAYHCSNKPFPGFPNSPLALEDKSRSAAQDAMRRAYDSWTQFLVTSAKLYLDTRTNIHSCAAGNSWIDNGNEVNESWYREGDPCDDGALACEYTDHADCFTSGNNRILASDIVINASTAWEIVQQNSLSRCLAITSISMENTAIHEIGHSYGLAHQESAVSVMNTNKPRVRNCDASQGFRDYPMPDDFQGYLQYHKNYTGSLFNVAGTVWYKNTGFGTKDKVRVVTNSAGPAAWTMSYTLHSYFAHAGASIVISYRAIPTSTSPAYNPRTGQWTNLGTSLPFATVSTVPGYFSKKVTIAMDVYRSELPANDSYRIWVHVDSGNALAEVSDRDNVFPTDVIVTRM